MSNLKFERLLLDNLCRILITDNDLEIARKTLYSLASRDKDVIAVSQKHKVSTILYNNISLLEQKGLINLVSNPDLETLCNTCRIAFENAIQHRELIRRQLVSVIKETKDVIEESFIILKGFSNSRFYMAPYIRWMRDIDLMCRNWESANEIYQVLIKKGYLNDDLENPWIKCLPNQDLYGQLFFQKPFDSDHCRFDIHFTVYSVSFNGHLDLHLNEYVEEFEIENEKVKGLSPEGCVLLSLAHMLSDGYVSIKDINDFVAISTAASPNWNWIGEQAIRNNYAPQATRFAKHILALYDDEKVQIACDKLLSALGKHANPKIWQTHNRSWQLRAIVNSIYTYEIERSEKRVVSSLLKALICFTYYIRRLKLVIRDRTWLEMFLWYIMPKPDLMNGVLYTDTGVVLIQVSQIDELAANTLMNEKLDVLAGLSNHYYRRKLGRSLYYLRLSNGELIITSRHIFIPTLDLIINPEQWKAVKDLIQRIKA